MSDTCTVSISDEVCMVDLVILVSVLLIIILRKWWDISESDELRSFEFTDNRILPFSLEYCFCTILRDDELLATILDEDIVDITSDCECHIGRDCPWSCCPGEDSSSC